MLKRQQYDRTPARRERQDLYDWQWRKYSRRRLSEHPYCIRCHAAGKIRAAVVTDHIRPHRGDVVLFRDPNNHQSLCKHCHDRKTRLEDNAPPLIVRASGTGPAPRALLDGTARHKGRP